MTRLLLLLLLAGPAAAASVELEHPSGGWRNPAHSTERTQQEVRYPAVTVNTPEGTRASGLIQGHIRNAPKSKQPATLIVNGAAMPQRVEDDGRFSRPYAFSAGSNSVELRAPDGSAKRVQFYDNRAGYAPPRLRVVLSWDSDNTDLDLHVVTPDGEHAFYGNRVLKNGGALDVDVTTGYGPEIFSTPSPVPGNYLVYVNYYGSGGADESMTITNITLITDEGTAREKQQSFRVPMRKAGELTLVKRFTFR